MFSKKLLFVLTFTIFAGTLAASAPVIKKDCIACTPYCKKHPTAPQCN